MKPTWYLSRLKKMDAAEVFKRTCEQLYIIYSRIKYSNPERCRYRRFADERVDINFQNLPSAPLAHDWKHYRIYDYEFDLTQEPDWLFSDQLSGQRWPQHHFAGIDYRPGNPFGDVRINWELNRLQFLPAMAAFDKTRTLSLVSDWCNKNPFLHGPGYIVSMEVALRWISIYWAACLLKNSLSPKLRRIIIGLAIASGNYIERRLSTHSSAGNHLIVEAVGLYWLGKALAGNKSGRQWISKARALLRQEVVRQINPDGSNQEQSFWYLGFVVDALLHYLLLEERNKIADEIWLRAERALEFIDELTLPEGIFPDYGDRDDGYVFRTHNSYSESPFLGLLSTGSYFFKRPEWLRSSVAAKDRLRFWMNDKGGDQTELLTAQPAQEVKKPQIKNYPDGGMTLMKWGKGRLLFRHSPLGLKNNFGHGHADALSVIFYWNSIPVLIDLGSGQYNGDQNVRNYFRSTIAHNTVEIGRQDQARMVGPFLWERPYETELKDYGSSPVLFARASHNGYRKDFSVVHTRMVEWISSYQFNIYDSFSESYELPIRGAFHLGPCRSVKQEGNIFIADFNNFSLSLIFPLHFAVDVFYGSDCPFIGWRSALYGKWEPIHSIVFSKKLQKENRYIIRLKVSEK